MAGILHQQLSITGSVNAIVYDTGLESTEEEPRHLDAVQVAVSERKGNTIEIWHDREQRSVISDFTVRTTELSAGNAPLADESVLEFPINIDLPIGTKVQVAIRCGANATNVNGQYVYHVREG